MEALRAVGVPYTDEDIATAEQVIAGPDGKGTNEADALVAYLQKLGVLLKHTR